MKNFIIELNEFKAEFFATINKAVNERGIPCSVVELVMQNALNSVIEGAHTELQKANEMEMKSNENSGDRCVVNEDGNSTI